MSARRFARHLLRRDVGYLPGDQVLAVKPSWGEDIAPVGAVGTVLPASSGALAVEFEVSAHREGSPWRMQEQQVRHADPVLRWRRDRELRRVRRQLSRAFRVPTRLIARRGERRSPLDVLHDLLHDFDPFD